MNGRARRTDGPRATAGRPAPPRTRPSDRGRYGAAKVRQGFTFAELLIVTLILALVLGVLGASIAAGIRVLGAARTVNTMESVAALGFEVVGKDLANTFPFYTIAFEGNDREVSFPGIVETASGRERGESLGHVLYTFDKHKGALLRTTWAFPGEEPSDRMPVTVADDLHEVKWSYAEADGGDLAWETTWDDTTNHPDVVRIELIFREGGRMKPFARTIVLPRAGREEE